MAKYEFLTIIMLSYSDVLKLRDIISQLCTESPEVAQAIAREIQECMRANLNRERSNLPASSSRRAGRQQKGVRKPRFCSHKSALPSARVLLAWDLPQSTDHSKVVQFSIQFNSNSYLMQPEYGDLAMQAFVKRRGT
jgi:hypothetical protein